MNPMTKEKAAALNRDLQVAIASIAGRHGMLIRSCVLSYGPTFVRIRAEIAGALDDDSPIADSAAVDFDNHAARIGLGHVARGEPVKLSDGRTYTVIGFKPRAKARPVIVERDGKQYMVPVAEIAAATRGGASGPGVGGVA